MFFGAHFVWNFAEMQKIKMKMKILLKYSIFWKKQTKFQEQKFTKFGFWF
jgi:hypothetical protein